MSEHDSDDELPKKVDSSDISNSNGKSTYELEQYDELEQDYFDLEEVAAEAGSPRQRDREPPPDKRWKKGQSGNPKGRPPGKKNKTSVEKQFYAAAQEVFGEELTYVHNGKKKKSSSHKLILTNLRTEALKNCKYARKDYIKLAQTMRVSEFLKFDQTFHVKRLKEKDIEIILSHPDIIDYYINLDDEEGTVDYSVLTPEERDQFREFLLRLQPTDPDQLARMRERGRRR